MSYFFAGKRSHNRSAKARINVSIGAICQVRVIACTSFIQTLLKQAEIVPELANEANIAYVYLDAPSYASSFPLRFEAVDMYLYRVEYYDPYRLLAALFASPVGATIDSPKWLRNLYINQLEKKLYRIIGDDTICLGTHDRISHKWTEGSKFIPMG